MHSEFDQAVEAFRRARSIFVFTGAGVSKESGLPTFREADGLWKKYDPMTLATMDAFVQDPVQVWNMYRLRQKQIAQAHPNPAHKIIAGMDDHYPRFLLVTQNVDDLHERANTRRMVKLHGDIWQMRCIDCGEIVDIHEIDFPDEFSLSTLPRCERCEVVYRPNIVWFGEFVPQDAMNAAVSAAASCDLMLIVGTSGEVSGGYGFTDYAHENGATIIDINPVAGALTRYADIHVAEPAGTALPRIWTALRG